MSVLQQASIPAAGAWVITLPWVDLLTGANSESTLLFVVWPLGQVAGLSIWLTGRSISNWPLQGGQKYS